VNALVLVGSSAPHLKFIAAPSPRVKERERERGSGKHFGLLTRQTAKLTRQADSQADSPSWLPAAHCSSAFSPWYAVKRAPSARDDWEERHGAGVAPPGGRAMPQLGGRGNHAAYCDLAARQHCGSEKAQVRQTNNQYTRIALPH